MIKPAWYFYELNKIETTRGDKDAPQVINVIPRHQGMLAENN